MTISEEGQKMIKIVFDHSFQIRGVNQYGTAVKILWENKDIGNVWLYGDSYELQKVIDKLNEKFIEDQNEEKAK